MRIWRSLDDVPTDLGRSVVVIGNFDGVHLGHRHVIQRARELADVDGLQVVAVTFDPHPIAVLRPEHAPLALTTIDRRCYLLSDAGVDDVLVIPFSREIAAWTPQDFVDRVIVGGLHAAAVVVGGNFRFGAKAAGDVAMLTEAGRSQDFVVIGVELDGGPQVWSSTYVRTCVAGGDVEGAAEALGRPHSVVRPGRRGRAAGSRARLSDRQRADERPRRSRGRGVRRVADRARRERAAADRRTDARGDQRRHQPDLRRRAGTPGGGLRAPRQRPDQSSRTSTSTARSWRSRSWRASAGWSRSRASRRSSRRWAKTSYAPVSCSAWSRCEASGGRPRPWPRPTSGSCATGCPTSCRSSERARGRPRLRRTVPLLLSQAWPRRPPVRVWPWSPTSSASRRPRWSRSASWPPPGTP